MIAGCGRVMSRRETEKGSKIGREADLGLSTLASTGHCKAVSAG